MIECLSKFNALISKENNCIELLYRLKWPNGFSCPNCQHSSAYKISTRKLPLYECRNCHNQISLTSGTSMHKSRTPLHKWLLTMFIISSTEQSINAVHLSKLISVTYKTAWAMLHKIRLTLSEADRLVLLEGNIEAKLEVYMKQPIPTYDALQRERPVIIARSVSPATTSYFKIKLVTCQNDARRPLTKEAQREFMTQHVNPNHCSVEMNRKFANPLRTEAILPCMAKSAFNWLNNTFHGLSLTYAQSYLDEFCFRQNVKSHKDNFAFESLVKLNLFSSTFTNSSLYSQSS